MSTLRRRTRHHKPHPLDGSLPAESGQQPPAESPSNVQRAGGAAVLLACFCSGAAGLVFQMVWFHSSGLVLGNSIWSTSIVLSSFMGGLALGGGLFARFGHKARALLLTYAVLELLVAVSGLAVTAALSEATAFAGWLGGSGGPWRMPVRVVAAFAVLAVPATAMGATLPALTVALARRHVPFGSALGWMYGWNTFGAVAGVLVAELVLVRELGMNGSAWFAAGLNLTAAMLAWRSSHQVPEAAIRTPLNAAPGGFDGRSVAVLGSTFLAGTALMAYEVVWLRFLSLFVVNTTLAISLVLAVVLSAIAVGGLAGSAWTRHRNDAATWAPAVALAVGGSAALAYFGFQLLAANGATASPIRILLSAASLAFLPAMGSGLLFILLGQSLEKRVGVATKAAGLLSLVNTAGAMCGPLAAGFFLLPTLGMERSFFVLFLVYALVAALAGAATWGNASRWARRTHVGIALLVAVLVVRFPFGLMSDSYFAHAVAPYAADGSRVVATREGAVETVFLMEQSWLEQPVYHRLVTNGFSMTGTHLSGARYMRSFVYLPMLLHQGDLQRVLVICYGIGVTVGAAVSLESPRSIDVVEISPDVIAMSDRVYYGGTHPLKDPRVRTHVEDGRLFLATSSERFDLITGEPPPPLTPGAVNLYTREYFQLMYDRLADGGIATYWLPVAREGEYDVAPIVRAFCDVFADCSLWNGALFDWMLMGSRKGGPATTAPEISARPWLHPVTGPLLREVGFEVPEQLGATFLGDAPFLDALTAGVDALTDNYPQGLLPNRRAGASDRPGRFIGNDPELFRQVIDAGGARDRFARSPFVDAHFPEATKQDTLPYFEQQGRVNHVMSEGAEPVRDIALLHQLLTQTDLRRLPLWLLGSNDAVQRIAERVSDDQPGGVVAFVNGLRALAIRNYRGAATSLAKAERLGFSGPSVRELRVYALCMSGDLDSARHLAAGRRGSGAAEQRFWAWMAETFDVDSSSRS